jgi:hypothetical protein
VAGLTGGTIGGGLTGGTTIGGEGGGENGGGDTGGTTITGGGDTGGTTTTVGGGGETGGKNAYAVGQATVNGIAVNVMVGRIFFQLFLRRPGMAISFSINHPIYRRVAGQRKDAIQTLAKKRPTTRAGNAVAFRENL